MSPSPRRRALALLGAIGATAALLVARPAPAGGQEDGPAPATPDVDGAHVTGIVSDDPAVGIHPDVAALATTSEQLEEVSVGLRTTLELQASATRRRDDATTRLTDLAAERAGLEVRLVSARVLHARQEQRVDDARSSLRAVALDAYVQAGGSSSGVSLDPRTVHDGLERDALAGTVREHHSEQLESATEALDVVGRHLDQVADRMAAVVADIEATTTTRDAATADLADAEARLPGEREAVDDAWRTSFVQGTEIPLVAADAYYRSAAALVFEDPTCGVPWEAIAAIGRVEGHHGSFGASELQPDSTSEPRIYGIPLDGSRGTRVIGDTDGGSLDGLPTIDRAVGPMQFIPSTWVRWATDGDGDDITDPHSLYDAARTAGVYLCQSGPGLTDDAGLLRSFFSYNRSAPYGQRVLALTHEYDQIGL